MKRLTKDERTGATAIALVALIICGGSFLWNRRERSTPHSEEVVKSLILASDSLDKGSEPEVTNLHDTSGNKKKSDRKKTSERGTAPSVKRKGGKPIEKRKKEAAPPRDFLSDPV
ncbi:MAG: hypothetical protein K2K81_03520 [Muribaculaceae bacterium]|nr:hypothetical protein [Muribaculaceae bacterium]